MRKILCLLCLLAYLPVQAQAPQGFNFQALAKNASNQPVVNGNVALRLSILDGSASGASVYSETHNASTNDKGVFSVQVGLGTVVSGQFNNISWASASKFLKIEMDATGGTNYNFMGTQQLMSVPYALQAGESQWKNVSGGITYSKNASNNVYAYNTDVNFGFSQYGTVKQNSTDTIETVLFSSNNATLGKVGGIGTNTNHPLSFRTNNSERMRIDQNGFVGIGTTTPTVPLTFSGAAGDQISLYYNATNNTHYGIGISTQLLQMYSDDITSDIAFGHGKSSAFTENVRFKGNGEILAGRNTTVTHINPVDGSPKTSKVSIAGTEPVVMTIQRNYANCSYAAINMTDTVYFGVSGPGNLSLGHSLRMDGGSLQITPSGNVGIGTASPLYQFTVTKQNDRARMYAHSFSNTQVHAGTLVLGHARGTEAVPTALQNLDILGRVAFVGHNGTSHDHTAYSSMIGQATENWTSTAMGSGLGFWTVPNGTKTPVERMVIQNNGNVGIGTSAPKSKLHVTSGDVYLDSVTSGIILKSPNGNCWRVTIDNAGNLVRTSITCP